MFGLVAPFTEAVRSLTQPCSFLLVVPIALVIAATRGRWQALAAASAASIVGGWALAGGWLTLSGAGLQLSALVVIVLMLGIVVAVMPTNRLGWVGPHIERRVVVFDGPGLQAAAAGVVAFVATLWWRPCVGEELGDALSNSQQSLVGEMVPMASYMAGTLLPAVLVALVFGAAGMPKRAANVVAVGAASFCLVIACSVLIGQHDDIVVTLTRWTLNE